MSVDVFLVVAGFVMCGSVSVGCYECYALLVCCCACGGRGVLC